MTREDKAKVLADRDRISHAFATKYHEFRTARRLAGLDIPAFRFCKLNSNNECVPADQYDTCYFGIPMLGAGLSRTDEGIFAIAGPAYAIAQGGGLEAESEFKIGAGGKIGRVVKASGARVILAATAGEAGEITDTDANDETINVVSDNTADTSLWVLILGYEATSGDAIYEYIALDGTTAVDGLKLFDEVYGAIILDGPSIYATATAPTGTITITNTTSVTTLITLAAVDHMGTVTPTIEDGRSTKIYADIDSIVAAEVILFGIDHNGDEFAERLTWTAVEGTDRMESTYRFSKIIHIAHGGVADARTIAYSSRLNEDIFDGWTNSEHNLTTHDAADKGNDDTLTVKSSSALDITQQVTVAWKNAANTWATTTVTLNGTSDVQIAALGDTVIGAWLDSVAVGTITIEYDEAGDGAGQADLLVWDGAATLGAGMVTPWGGDVAYAGIDLDGGNGLVTITESTGAATDFVLIEGFDRDGVAQVEGLTLAAGTKESTLYWSKITHIYAAGLDSVESLRLHLANDDAAGIAQGFVVGPSDEADEQIEVFLY